MIVLALPAGQIPAWNFAWDARACCCEKAGPCPCPDHELPDHEMNESFRACGSGGNFTAQVHPPELGFPPAAIAIALVAEPTSAHPPLARPHLPPDIDRPRGPS